MHCRFNSFRFCRWKMTIAEKRLHVYQQTTNGWEAVCPPRVAIHDAESVIAATNGFVALVKLQMVGHDNAAKTNWQGTSHNERIIALLPSMLFPNTLGANTSLATSFTCGIRPSASNSCGFSKHDGSKYKSSFVAAAGKIAGNDNHNLNGQSNRRRQNSPRCAKTRMTTPRCNLFQFGS